LAGKKKLSGAWAVPGLGGGPKIENPVDQQGVNSRLQRMALEERDYPAHTVMKKKKGNGASEGRKKSRGALVRSSKRGTCPLEKRLVPPSGQKRTPKGEGKARNAYASKEK